MSKLIIKVACSKNGVIGVDGKLPWHIPEDLKDFKESTMDKPIIMGRKTFESLPSLLPNRKHIVVTRNYNYTIPKPHLVTFTFEDAIESVHNYPKAYIIGGGEIYKQAMLVADEIEKTVIDRICDGDTLFPEIDYDVWEVKCKTDIPLKDSTVIEKITYVRKTQ